MDPIIGGPGAKAPCIGGLRHTAQGVAEDLFAGDIAIVRPGKTVQHAVLGDEELRMLGLWAEPTRWTHWWNALDSSRRLWSDMKSSFSVPEFFAICKLSFGHDSV